MPGDAAGVVAVAPERIEGVAWVAEGAGAPRHLPEVVDLGADWIAQTPFGWMAAPDDPGIRIASQQRIPWGEADAGLAETHRRAAELGLRTALKPHLWLHGSWPGEVAMQSDEDWAAWFAGYERFLLHYAELAEREGMDMLVVGTELKVATATREADWRRLIARARAVYHGPMTYAANWDEAEQVPFWDALDLVGVNAYFPLETATSAPTVPTVDDLVAAWAPWDERLARLAARTGKRIVYTEIGYRPVAGCTERPWEHDGGATGAAGEACQARAWEAVLAAHRDAPWFAGLFVWKWFPSSGERERRASFSPQGRPAEDVLREEFMEGDRKRPR